MNDRIQTVLIDDEPAANRGLAGLLESGHPNLEIAGVGTSRAEGLRLIAKVQPDLLFLDINLPDGTGFDLVRQLPLGQRPEIIFVTSEPGFAQQAIKVAALGYLVKPVDERELAEAIEIALMRIRQRNSEARLHHLLQNLERENQQDTQVGIPTEQGVDFVRAGDVLYCEGVDGYTRIVLDSSPSRLSSYSIGEYRKLLEPLGFLAAHRSYLVNRDHVVGWSTGGLLRMSSGDEITVSRRRKRDVLEWLR